MEVLEDLLPQEEGEAEEGRQSYLEEVAVAEAEEVQMVEAEVVVLKKVAVGEEVEAQL